MLSISRHRPLLLSSSVGRDNSLLVVDLMNPDLCSPDGAMRIKRGTIHIRRSSLLWQSAYYLELEITNHGSALVEEDLELRIAGDFRDIFEIRGMKRARRGVGGSLERDANVFSIAYEGLDGVRRSTLVHSVPQPDASGAEGISFALCIPPRDSQRIELRFEFDATKRPARFAHASRASGEDLAGLTRTFATVKTSNEECDQWLERSRADLAMMLTQTEHGPYPYAGVPWFSTVFGRDGIITALQCLWLNPVMGRSVLACLAATQARGTDELRAATPGKIVHEIRRGEMAALREIPFGQYYGTVDATPLFLMLAGAYFKRSADREFIESIWPSIMAACEWLERYGDLDGDGFIEFAADRQGLRNQGWKDSEDSTFHRNGALAEGPIALCEVQGYAYAGMLAVASLAHALRQPELALRMHQRAERLQRQFDAAYWVDDMSLYAMALDGSKRPCAVRTSNPGHCLFCGIVPPERAARMAEEYTHERFASGWGIRTLAADEVNYNPMSYHNGSVWPHDTAVVAAGLARYGFSAAAIGLLEDLLDASTYFDLHRMPELFCGFTRREDQGPTRYPLACSPQAWAAGSVFQVLGACLGLEIDAVAHRLVIRKPALPAAVDEVTVEGLTIADSRLDLVFHRHPGGVLVRVARCEGPVEVVVVTT